MDAYDFCQHSNGFAQCDEFRDLPELFSFSSPALRLEPQQNHVEFMLTEDGNINGNENLDVPLSVSLTKHNENLRQLKGIQKNNSFIIIANTSNHCLTEKQPNGITSNVELELQNIGFENDQESPTPGNPFFVGSHEQHHSVSEVNESDNTHWQNVNVKSIEMCEEAPNLLPQVAVSSDEGVESQFNNDFIWKERLAEEVCWKTPSLSIKSHFQHFTNSMPTPVIPTSLTYLNLFKDENRYCLPSSRSYALNEPTLTNDRFTCHRLQLQSNLKQNELSFQRGNAQRAWIMDHNYTTPAIKPEKNYTNRCNKMRRIRILSNSTLAAKPFESHYLAVRNTTTLLASNTVAVSTAAAACQKENPKWLLQQQFVDTFKSNDEFYHSRHSFSKTPMRNEKDLVLKRRRERQYQQLLFHREQQCRSENVTKTPIIASRPQFCEEPNFDSPVISPLPRRIVEDTIELQRTNRKYRRQHQSLNALVGKQGMFCASCRMRYFYPASLAHKYVRWIFAVGDNGAEGVGDPEPYFSCKVCGFHTLL